MSGVFRRYWGALYRRRAVGGVVTATGGGSPLSVTAQQGLIHVTGQNATVNLGRNVTATQGVIHLTGQNAGVTTGLSVTATQGVIHLTGQNPTVTTSRDVTATQGVIYITGQNPTVQAGAVADSPTGGWGRRPWKKGDVDPWSNEDRRRSRLREEWAREEREERERVQRIDEIAREAEAKKAKRRTIRLKEEPALSLEEIGRLIEALEAEETLRQAVRRRRRAAIVLLMS